MTRRQGRSKQLLDDLKKERGYCKLKEEALDRYVWRSGFGGGCGPVVRQTRGMKSLMVTVQLIGCTSGAKQSLDPAAPNSSIAPAPHK